LQLDTSSLNFRRYLDLSKTPDPGCYRPLSVLKLSALKNYPPPNPKNPVPARCGAATQIINPINFHKTNYSIIVEEEKEGDNGRL